ncbi:MAG: hypothetical protein VB049_04825 [Candidatus Pelethousia sp.]|nr:hypothetical protein [Candidatus Pelethousia sp.]
MQLYTALLLCVLVLSLTGGLKPFQPIVALGRFQTAFFALSMLALSRFDFSPNPETRFNLCAVFMPLALALWARTEAIRGGVPCALAAFSLVAFGAEKAGFFAGAQSGVLTGFIAGASAAALADTPKTALAVAAAIPLVCAILSTCFALVTGSYVVMDFGQVALRDAQMSALCFGSVLLCMYTSAKRKDMPGEQG